MDTNEQNKIMSQNRKDRDIKTKLDQLVAMVTLLSEQVAELQPKRARTKKEEA